MGNRPSRILCYPTGKIKWGGDCYRNRKKGEDITVNSEKDDAVKRVKEITGLGVDVCLECGGYPEAITQALVFVRKRERVVMIGLQKSQPCDLEDMLWNEKQLVASLSSTYQEFGTGIKLAEEGKLRTDPDNKTSSLFH